MSKKVILVVDDDATILALYKRMFELRGIDILIARDGEEGVTMIREHMPDFVILDIRMPKLDGIEALKIIRSEEKIKDTPVLILTNFDHQEYRDETNKLGIVDFLVKINIDPSLLVEKVVSYLTKLN